MIGYSGIYSPNNKKNQESITIRLVYSQNSENRESRNYKCMAFSGFSLPNCDLCPSPMIKYSFFKKLNNKNCNSIQEQPNKILPDSDKIR